MNPKLLIAVFVINYLLLVGFVIGIAIAVNNISGPAMLDLPRVFDAAGIVPTSLAIIVTCIISSLVATMLAGEKLLQSVLCLCFDRCTSTH